MFKGPIALGTLRTSFVLGLRLLIQAGTLLLVARMLGPKGFAAFAGVASLAVLLGTLSTFGTQLVLLGEMSKDSDRRDEVLAYAIPTTLICGGLLFLVYIALACWLLPSIALSWIALLAIGFAEIMLQPLFGFMSTEHHALGRIAHAQFMQNGPLALRLLTALSVFSLDLSPALNLYAGGYLTASVFCLLMGAYCLPRSWPGWWLWRLPRIEEWRLSFGCAAVNFSKLGSTELDKVLAVKLLPMDAAGIYTSGARVVGAITLPITAMALAALPRLFRESVKRTINSRNLLVWMYSAAFFYSLLLAGVLWFFSPVLAMLFGEKYQGMNEVIRLLCFAVPGVALRLVGGNVLMGMGEQWMRCGFEVVGLVVLVSASMIFIGRSGALGLPLAVIYAEWGMAICGICLVAQARMKGPKLAKKA